ncbi:CIS tube protein [Streptoalloteichus hindustanus]|uniref:LysM domain-containing protein n=1 Tax=Streptoalloteichus hindustanus TaxID=2017 RepID=A0A1M5CLR2_STRHI|nr:LysM peptidoglycan-binding domain-containing protein [Streptoalloteichus hindustanus]SHF55653.1 LysM domain-containing protein [Streptoalloteichus hindustanus]
MSLTKIHFEVLDKAAVDRARGLSDRFVAQFNPTDYTLVKGAQLAEIGIPGVDSPVLQFVRGQDERLTLELLFDTTADGMGEKATDVRTLTRQVYQLVKIQPATHAPPRFRLTWGKGLSFTAIAEQVQQRFTLFSPSGIPLRATVTLSLREYKTLEQQLAELKLQSPDHTKVRAVRRGETLATIAAREYDDPGAWRAIADRNPGVDPRRPRPGTVLEIPPLAPGNAP